MLVKKIPSIGQCLLSPDEYKEYLEFKKKEQEKVEPIEEENEE